MSQHSEAEANARLIAKAPEMYEFLKYLNDLWTLQAGSKASLDTDRETIRALLWEIGGAVPDRRIGGEEATFLLKMKTVNAAFHEADGDHTPEALRSEVARILRRVAEHVEEGGSVGACVDANGNTVGGWEVSS